MSRLFFAVLNMSLTASVAVTFVLLLRLVLRKAPKKYTCALWAAVFFRLALPFSIPLAPPLPAAEPFWQRLPPLAAVLPPTLPKISIEHAFIGTGTTAESGLPGTDGEVGKSDAAPAKRLSDAAAVIWLGGVLAFWAYAAASILRLRRKTAEAVRFSDNIFLSGRVETPFVLGFWRPKILLPPGLSGDDLAYIAAHEQAHLRRLDHWTRPLCFLIAAVHWFNPLAWLSFALMTRDAEHAADESALSRLGLSVKGAYARLLLSFSMEKSGLSRLLAFGETALTARIKNVLSWKKPVFWVSAAGFMAVLLASVWLLLGQTDKTPGDTPTPPPDIAAESTVPPDRSLSPDTDWARDILTLSPAGTFQPSHQSAKLSFSNGYHEYTVIDPQILGYIEAVLALDQPKLPEKAVAALSSSPPYGTITLYSAKEKQTFTLYTAEGPVAEEGGIFRKIDPAFFRYLTNLTTDKPAHTVVSEEAATLFAGYGWTVCYETALYHDTLRGLSGLSAWDPGAYYYACFNVLSKDIGLDMAPYNGMAAEIAAYRLFEPLPAEHWPQTAAVGFTVFHEGQIIGAYIGTGYHTYAACSLQGNSFTAAAGQTVDRWLAAVVTPDESEARLAALSPEEILAEYGRAMTEKDAAAVTACMSRHTMLSDAPFLNPNLPGPYLSTPYYLPHSGAAWWDERWGGKPFGNMISFRQVRIDPPNEYALSLIKPAENERVFLVTLDGRYRKPELTINGELEWICTMVYESPQTGWKIQFFGH